MKNLLQSCRRFFYSLLLFISICPGLYWVRHCDLIAETDRVARIAEGFIEPDPRPFSLLLVCFFTLFLRSIVEQVNNKKTPLDPAGFELVFKY